MPNSVIAALALLILSAAPVTAQTDRTLTIVGHAEVQAPPDSALVTVGVTSEADTAAAALQASSAAMAKVLAAIRSSGIDAQDVQTSGLSLEPRYSRSNVSAGGEKLRVIGYTATNEVSVRERDLGQLGTLLDKVTTAGANRITGIRFLLAKEDELLDEARKQAVADARRKGELYAHAGGFSLGKILSLAEESASSPRPLLRAGMASAASVPIEAGDLTLSARVRVVWSISD
jgi:uncharacterized protein YggE